LVLKTLVGTRQLDGLRWTINDHAVLKDYSSLAWLKYCWSWLDLQIHNHRFPVMGTDIFRRFSKGLLPCVRKFESGIV